MLKGKYRTVFAAGVAAVLAGAALFSPSLSGMTCLETPVEKTIAAVEAAPAADEFVGEFVESGVVGCLLTHVVLNIDWSDWASVLEDGARVWVGVEAVRLAGAIAQRSNELVSMVRP